MPNTDVCEEETNDIANNCRAPIAQRHREHPGVPATARAVFLYPYGCGGMRLLWADDEGQVHFDDLGIWLRAADGRVARVSPLSE